MNKKVKIVVIILLAGFVIIQFIPVNRPAANTGEEYNFFAANDVPADVEHLVRNACFDCHSMETDYPWYAYVAPTSWLVTSDVREAREHLNFSEWDRLSKQKKLKILDDIGDEVKSKDMPLKIFLIMHLEARLTSADREIIVQWAGKMANKVLEE